MLISFEQGQLDFKVLKFMSHFFVMGKLQTYACISEGWSYPYLCACLAFLHMGDMENCFVERYILYSCVGRGRAIYGCMQPQTRPQFAQDFTVWRSSRARQHSEWLLGMHFSPPYLYISCFFWPTLIRILSSGWGTKTTNDWAHQRYRECPYTF